MTDDTTQPPSRSSGVFKAIVDGARAVKRALSENDASLSPELTELGNEIGRCFIANRFAELHAMSAAVLQQTTDISKFVASWRDAIARVEPLTGFDVSDAGDIELDFIPSLEDVPQSKFLAFLQISFSNPTQEDAFTLGAVILDDNGQPRIGALHAR